MRQLNSYIFPGAVLTSLALAFAPASQAAISYSTPGSTYSQNFDSLPNTPQNVSLGNSPIGWIDDTATPGTSQFSIVGFYLFHSLPLTEGGANGNQRVRIGAGTVNTGAFMSFGASGNTERALGDVGSNTLASTNTATNSIYFGLRLNNATGQTLDSFTLTYDGEQWRDGGANGGTPTAQTMNFGWSTAATSISDTNVVFNGVSGLSFTSPVFVNTTTGAAVDGNTAGLIAGITATVTGINWTPGSDLWLRWDDANHSGNDHGLAIDNVNFSALPQIPEPGTYALLGIGALAVWISRRSPRRLAG